MAIHKDPRAIEVADTIRGLYSASMGAGWFSRCHHANRQIKIGHPNYGIDPCVTMQLDAVAHSVERLNLLRDIPYSLVICQE